MAHSGLNSPKHSFSSSSSSSSGVGKARKLPRRKRKERKNKKPNITATSSNSNTTTGHSSLITASITHSTTNQDKFESLDIDSLPPGLRAQFKDVFAKFAPLSPSENPHSQSVSDSSDPEDDNTNSHQALSKKVKIISSHLDKNNLVNGSEKEILETTNSDFENVSDTEDTTLSKRKQRKASRLTVAELKQLVDKPEVVEWVDVCATDPKLLVEIKSKRGIVPIPIHWSQKRKYLQNKRGIEKKPFELPDFIKATGIQTMKEVTETPDATLKQKTRERVQPKVGKVVIDYAKLHDAFFKWQTKPDMSVFGDIYHEGRENETRLKSTRPGGNLSDALREALGIGPLAPPPWLINMQRFGPPPSYQGLKIPGLNAPIPAGASWGFHHGGWGKPPLDEYGRPLYGDVFGTAYDQTYVNPFALPVSKELWGEFSQPAYKTETVAEHDENNDDDDDDDGDNDADIDMVGKGEHSDPHSRGLRRITRNIDGIGAEDEDEDDDNDGEDKDKDKEDVANANDKRAIHIAGVEVEFEGDLKDGLREKGGLPTSATENGTEGVERSTTLYPNVHGGSLAQKEIDEFVAGLQTPAIPADIELRKSTKSAISHVAIENATAGAAASAAATAATASASGTALSGVSKVSGTVDPKLYTVLEEKKIVISGLMGSERIYEIGQGGQPVPGGQGGITPVPPGGLSSAQLQDKKRVKSDENKKKKEFKF